MVLSAEMPLMFQDGFYLIIFFFYCFVCEKQKSFWFFQHRGFCHKGRCRSACMAVAITRGGTKALTCGIGASCSQFALSGGVP